MYWQLYLQHSGDEQTKNKAKMMFRMAHIYPEYTYSVCVSRSLWSEDSDKCAPTGVWQLPVLAVYLVEPQNRCIEQMELFKCCSQQENDNFGNKNTSIYIFVFMWINKYMYIRYKDISIQIHNYIAVPALHFSNVACRFTSLVRIWS